MTTEVLQQDIQQLLEFFSKNLYRAKECSVGDEIVQRCSALMRKDYSVVEILNQKGDLSAHYPAKLLIPEQEVKKTYSFGANVTDSYGEYNPGDGTNHTPRNGEGSDTRSSLTNSDQVIVDGKLDAQRLRFLILQARLARCRARFPVPVILYKGKYVCRSATLSGGPEIYGRSGLEYFAYAAESKLPEPGDEAYKVQEESVSDESESNDWALFEVRKKDIRLLKALNVGAIIDFMVENKKVKFGVNVSSSEKVDKENRYNFFKIVALPYPGCEFFKEYLKNNCNAEGLIFDWNQSYVDAGIRVPEDPIMAQLNIDWDNYKQWDLTKITQNYLRLLLKYLQEDSSGILVHCISGWDRTPLFVSLLRISLWADGTIHQTLDAAQMLYFTIAYDWLLFGHHLPDRLNKREVIFYFCFYMLKYIVDEEYSVLPHRYRSQHSSGSSSIDVIRTDSDSMLDGLLLDGESRGSSVSLNSVSSYMSGRSSSMQDTHTCVSTGIGLTSGGASNSIAITARNGNGRVEGGSANGCNGGDDSVNSLNGNNGFSVYSHGSSSSIGCISHDSSNHNNQWSPPPRRTSPVTVPSANRLRQRQESSSSLSVGSWQMITGTGSYRSADSVNEMHSHLQRNPGHNSQHQNHHQQQQPPHQTSNQMPSNYSSLFYSQQQQQQPGGINAGPSSNSSSSTPNANQHHPSQDSIDGEYNPIQIDRYALRRERLTEMRTRFFNCYFSTIGFKFHSGPDSSLGSLIGNFAERVGLTNRAPV